MLDGEQLELNVQTIQPDEVYLVYADVTESWDSTYREDRGEEYDDCVGFGPGRYVEHKTREIVQEKLLQGVIVDDHTLDIIKARMEPYARRWEDEVKLRHAGSLTKPNFDITVEYILEPEKRIVL